ncbi:hypothetical protein [Bradyrhizobium sp. SZCCHNS2002]|uniref:hypothetical protein n=1 Tax=Bradyrhizobium sp. SZCCHNS2002 TaxID=3057302 RepID=UPI0029160408|nr:hypothetical protein [Bradyrhizobium sp. SZCCHNS2002]
MPTHVQQLEAELPAIQKLAQSSGANGFYAQEVLRFRSIAGTMLAVKEFTLDEKATVDERYITHILSRSLIENYFRIIYIFDDPAQTASRYEALKNSFRKEYSKLLNEPQLPHKDQLEPAGSSWPTSPGELDLNSMLTQVRNDYGDRLSYLYFVYRVASFDTHGKNLPAILEDVFGKKCNFPVLKIGQAFELMANQYLVVLNDLRSKGVV